MSDESQQKSENVEPELESWSLGRRGECYRPDPKMLKYSLSREDRDLANQFALACGVRACDNIAVAAQTFRKQKTREFWNYLLFLILFSLSTLQQVGDVLLARMKCFA